jgi:uncharacterized protein involved in exopolysaccharide biosynthesis
MKVEYQPHNVGNQGASEDEEGGGIDWDKIAGYRRFVIGSLGRRKFIVFGVFVTVVALSYGIYWSLPRSYHVETQLLAQRNQVIPSMVVSQRSIQDLGPPTRAAAETVLRRDNLVALIQQADLVANWDRGRSGASRIRGWISAKLGKVPTEDEKMDVILGTLESKLTVKVVSDFSGEGTVNIALDWGDARMGYRIVTAAQQSFIEARHLSEISSISEALSILVSRATTMRKEIDSTVRAIEEKSPRKGETVRRRSEGGARLPRSLTPVPGESSAAAAEREATLQLLSQWEGKKTAIKDLEDMRRRRLNELQTKLTELRATYAESHPNVVDTVQTIETLQAESPTMVALRKEEAAIHSQYLARTAKSAEPIEGLPQPIARDNSVRVVATPSAADDRETEFAKNQLRFQAEAYDRVLERIEGAQMELEAARAAFKHRFVVVRPAQVPRGPEKPKPAKVLGGGVAAALVLAVLAAVVADLRSGRVYASWQLERALRLPVLAEIRRDHET